MCLNSFEQIFDKIVDCRFSSVWRDRVRMNCWSPRRIEHWSMRIINQLIICTDNFRQVSHGHFFSIRKVDNQITQHLFFVKKFELSGSNVELKMRTFWLFRRDFKKDQLNICYTLKHNERGFLTFGAENILVYWGFPFPPQYKTYKVC